MCGGGDAGGSEQHVCKVILVISLSLGHAEQKFIEGIVVLSDVVQLGRYKHKNMLADTHETAYIPSLKNQVKQIFRLNNLFFNQHILCSKIRFLKNILVHKNFGSN